MPALKDLLDYLEDQIPEDQRRILNEGSSHMMMCRCDTCRRYWYLLGPDEDGEYGPFTLKEITSGVWHVQFDLSKCERARERNRLLLGQGVAGVECTYVGPDWTQVSEHRHEEMWAVVNTHWEIRSCEVYKTGAANVFIAPYLAQHATGAILIREPLEAKDGDLG